MSIKLLDKIFGLRFPPPEKLVMLALGNYANDNGGSCFPSVARIAEVTGLSRRGVQKILRRLQQDGYLRPVGARPGALGNTASP